MSNPKLKEEASACMQNYSSHVDEAELGACCLEMLPPASSSKSGAQAMHTNMFGSEMEYFKDTSNELDDLISSMEKLPNDLEEKINFYKSATSAATSSAPDKQTFQNQLIDFLYGSVIRDGEIALTEVQNQPGTTKSNKMIEYYSKHCLFILGLLRQEKASCLDGNGVCNDQPKLKELVRAEECLDKLAKSFAEKQSSSSKK